MIGRSTRQTDKTSLIRSCSAKHIALGTISAIALIYSGCSMCCGPYDYDYPAVGGSVQRADPVWGRVGSIYSDPGPFGGPHADYNLRPHESGTALSDDSLEDFNGDDPDLEPPPENMLEEESEDNGSDVLPPPTIERPGPDEETSSLQRLRSQSRNRGRGQRWR